MLGKFVAGRESGWLKCKIGVAGETLLTQDVIRKTFCILCSELHNQCRNAIDVRMPIMIFNVVFKTSPSDRVESGSGRLAACCRRE